MKKKTMVTVAMSVIAVGIASADLSISWKNTAVAVSSDGTTGGFVNDNLVQLIWSATGNITAAGACEVEGGAMLAGEFLLAQTTVHPASPPVGFWGPIGGVYTSADVGGADINAGFFFTRIFETAHPYGLWQPFYDTQVVDTSAWVYDPLTPSTVYSSEAISDVAPGGTLDLSANGTVMCPEPSTVGLVGLSSGGLFFIRNLRRRTGSV